ncbi:MAG: insulinase family protein [Gammaproteobacteria bacterium]|nr:insulinase family protein [Gammaproteobacteria bacterium]
MRFITLCILTLSLLTPAYANMSKVTEFTLPNGLKIIVKEDHRAPVVISELWYKVGASYEPDGISGISHALEHMMFRGTKKYGPGVLKKIIADNGGDINAFTDYDCTGYYELLDVAKLPLALELEADRMHGLLLDTKAFSKEKQVILEELRMRVLDNPQARTYERFMAAAFIANPYHRPVIGWPSDIENLTAQDLRKWYEDWYAPNNAILVVVGDVKPQHVYQLAQKYFAPLPERAVPQLKPQPDLSPLGKRTVEVNVPAKLPWLLMGYNVPSLKSAKNEWEPYALEMAAAILDGSDSARFTRDLVRGQQLAVQVGASYDLYARLDSLFVLDGTPAPGHNVQQLQTAFTKEIKVLQTTLISKQELEQVKAGFIADKIYAKDSIAEEASEIGSLESIGLSWRIGEQYEERIKAVTPAQIRKVAQKYFTPDHLTVATLKPEGKS